MEEPPHVKGIRTNLTFLAQNTTSLKMILVHLVEKSILAFAEIEEIELRRTTFDRNTELYVLLTRKGPRMWNILLNALRNTGNEFVAERLEGSMTPIDETDSVLFEKRARLEMDETLLPFMVIEGEPEKLENFENSMKNIYSTLQILTLKYVRAEAKHLMKACSLCYSISSIEFYNVQIIGNFDRRIPLPQLRGFWYTVAKTGKVSFPDEQRKYVEALLFFRKDSNTPWNFENLWSMGVNIYVKIGGVEIITIDHDTGDCVNVLCNQRTRGTNRFGNALESETSLQVYKVNGGYWDNPCYTDLSKHFNPEKVTKVYTNNVSLNINFFSKSLTQCTNLTELVIQRTTLLDDICLHERIHLPLMKKFHFDVVAIPSKEHTAGDYSEIFRNFDISGVIIFCKDGTRVARKMNGVDLRLTYNGEEIAVQKNERFIGKLADFNSIVGWLDRNIQELTLTKCSLNVSALYANLSGYEHLKSVRFERTILLGRSRAFAYLPRLSEFQLSLRSVKENITSSSVKSDGLSSPYQMVDFDARSLLFFTTGHEDYYDLLNVEFKILTECDKVIEYDGGVFRSKSINPTTILPALDWNLSTIHLSDCQLNRKIFYSSLEPYSRLKSIRLEEIVFESPTHSDSDAAEDNIDGDSEDIQLVVLPSLSFLRLIEVLYCDDDELKSIIFWSNPKELFPVTKVPGQYNLEGVSFEIRMGGVQAVSVEHKDNFGSTFISQLGSYSTVLGAMGTSLCEIQLSDILIEDHNFFEQFSKYSSTLKSLILNKAELRCDVSRCSRIFLPHLNVFRLNLTLPEEMNVRASTCSFEFSVDSLIFFAKEEGTRVKPHDFGSMDVQLTICDLPIFDSSGHECILVNPIADLLKSLKNIRISTLSFPTEISFNTCSIYGDYLIQKLMLQNFIDEWAVTLNDVEISFLPLEMAPIADHSFKRIREFSLRNAQRLDLFHQIQPRFSNYIFNHLRRLILHHAPSFDLRIIQRCKYLKKLVIVAGKIPGMVKLSWLPNSLQDIYFNNCALLCDEIQNFNIMSLVLVHCDISRRFVQFFKEIMSFNTESKDSMIYILDTFSNLKLARKLMQYQNPKKIGYMINGDIAEVMKQLNLNPDGNKLELQLNGMPLLKNPVVPYFEAFSYGKFMSLEDFDQIKVDFPLNSIFTRLSELEQLVPINTSRFPAQHNEINGAIETVIANYEVHIEEIKNSMKTIHTSFEKFNTAFTKQGLAVENAYYLYGLRTQWPRFQVLWKKSVTSQNLRKLHFVNITLDQTFLKFLKRLKDSLNLERILVEKCRLEPSLVDELRFEFPQVKELMLSICISETFEKSKCDYYVEPYIWWNRSTKIVLNGEVQLNICIRSEPENAVVVVNNERLLLIANHLLAVPQQCSNQIGPELSVFAANNYSGETNEPLNEFMSFHLAHLNKLTLHGLSVDNIDAFLAQFINLQLVNLSYSNSTQEVNLSAFPKLQTVFIYNATIQFNIFQPSLEWKEMGFCDCTFHEPPEHVQENDIKLESMYFMGCRVSGLNQNLFRLSDASKTLSECDCIECILTNPDFYVVKKTVVENIHSSDSETCNNGWAIRKLDTKNDDKLQILFDKFGFCQFYNDVPVMQSCLDWEPVKSIYR